MTRRLRTDRMRERARHVYAAAALRDSIAELAEKVAHGDVSLNAARVAMGFPPIRQLRGVANRPTRPGCGHEPSWWTQDESGYTCMVCGRQPHVRKRGAQRMREHTRSLLLGALRGDGTLRSAASIAACRAYRVLPDEIGLTADGRILDGIRGAQEIREEFAADMAADLGIIAAELSFGLPDGLEFVVSEDPLGTQIELAHPPTPWTDPNGDPTE